MFREADFAVVILARHSARTSGLSWQGRGSYYARIQRCQIEIGPGLFDDGCPTYRKLRRCTERAKCSFAPAIISGNAEVLNGSGFCFWHPERCGVRAVPILDPSRTYASINASRVAQAYSPRMKRANPSLQYMSVRFPRGWSSKLAFDY